MMAVEEALLDILVCPVDKGELFYFPEEATLYNPRLRRLYRIEEGVPVMLAGKSVPVSDEEHNRLVSSAGKRSARAG
jgi:uncharacterized protein